jgi:GTPase
VRPCPADLGHGPRHGQREEPGVSAGPRRPKVYHVTQVATQPPTIVFFCNDPHALSPQYQRYLLGVLRGWLPFSEVPIKLYLRRRETADTRNEIDAKLGQQP